MKPVASSISESEAEQFRLSGWPIPLPLPSGLSPVLKFDPEQLPDSIRGWVQDVTDRMQCPPEFPAVAAMVSLSSLIGRKACVLPKRHDSWTVFPNLWGVVVGRPGAMKSPALSEALRFLDMLDAASRSKYEEDTRQRDIKLKMTELKAEGAGRLAKKAIKDGREGDAEKLLQESMNQLGESKPVQRRYKVVDPTVEALGEILIENPSGTLLYRDELSGLLKSLDKDGQEGARAFYLQGYDGNQGYAFDRIGRGRDLHIPAVCISMLGGIQPGKLETYIRDALSGGAGDDGLLQRFGMLVWPDEATVWLNVDRKPDEAAHRRALDIYRRLDELPPNIPNEHGQHVPIEYRFSAEAQIEFEAWRAELEDELRSNRLFPALESHLAKYRKLVPAIALICTLADDKADVDLPSIRRAILWAGYLRSHAERAYGAGMRMDIRSAQAMLKRIQDGVVRDGFRVRDIYLKGWAHLSNKKEVQHAVELLVDLGWLRCIEQGTGAAGGRPTAHYVINPIRECML